MAEIKTHEWFQKDYIPVTPYDDNDEDVQHGAIFTVKEVRTYETKYMMLATNMCLKIDSMRSRFVAADR
jgi:hypothetical protein